MLAEDNLKVGIMKKLITEVKGSFEKLKKCDGMLFECPVEVNADYDARKLHEVCINHRLAVYFKQKILYLYCRKMKNILLTSSLTVKGLTLRMSKSLDEKNV